MAQFKTKVSSPFGGSALVIPFGSERLTITRDSRYRRGGYVASNLPDKRFHTLDQACRRAVAEAKEARA